MSKAKLYPTWQETVVFAPDGPQPQKLIETDTFKAVLVGLEPNQQIPPHPAPTSTYHFLEGKGWMVVGDERFTVGPGATIVVPDGAIRSFEAETRVAFLGTQAAD